MFVCVFASEPAARLRALMRDQGFLHLHPPQSLLRPCCSPPVLPSHFITIWTSVCRLLSLCPPLPPPHSLVWASHAIISFQYSAIFLLWPVKAYNPWVYLPKFPSSLLFPVQPISLCHTVLWLRDSLFLLAIKLFFFFTCLSSRTLRFSPFQWHYGTVCSSTESWKAPNSANNYS